MYFKKYSKKIPKPRRNKTPHEDKENESPPSTFRSRSRPTSFPDLNDPHPKSKGQEFLRSNVYIGMFTNGLVRIVKLWAFFSLQSLFYTWKYYLQIWNPPKFSFNIFGKWKYIKRKKERKKIERKGNVGGVTLLQGYACIHVYYLNFVKIWLCHYHFLEVMQKLH